MKSLLLILIVGLSISVSAQDDKNPEVWARAVVEHIRANNAESIAEKFYLTKEQLKESTTIEMDAAGYEGSGREALNNENFLTELYVQSRTDFTKGIEHFFSENERLNLEKIKIRKVVFDYVLPKYRADDIEIIWPQSKSFIIDENITTLARIKMTFKAKGKRYTLRMQPVLLDGEWRMIEPPYIR